MNLLKDFGKFLFVVYTVCFVLYGGAVSISFFQKDEHWAMLLVFLMLYVFCGIILIAGCIYFYTKKELIKKCLSQEEQIKLIQESENKYRSLFESSIGGAFVTRHDGKIIYY